MRHLKGLIILLFVLFLVFPQLTFAHTKLDVSTPEPDSTVTGDLKEVSMEFNTEVASLSTFKVVNDKGEDVQVNDILINGKRMSGSFSEPIPNGEYTVQWKIVGGDGHPIEGEFSFTVDAPLQTQEPEQPATGQDVTEAPTQTPALNPSSQPVESERVETDHQATGQDRNQSLFWIVSGVIILGVIVLLFGRRRKP